MRGDHLTVHPRNNPDNLMSLSTYRFTPVTNYICSVTEKSLRRFDNKFYSLVHTVSTLSPFPLIGLIPKFLILYHGMPTQTNGDGGE